MTKGDVMAVSERTISRRELLEVIDRASVDCPMSTREKLRAVGLTTGAFAVGWFHCDGVGCPTRQARRSHQGFQQRFDTEMAALFDAEYETEDEIVPFVVTVLDAR